MNANELRGLLASPAPPLLIQVLPAEVFAVQRIPGSLSACVHEVAFPERIAGLVGETSRPIVVYGAGGGSLEARVAGEKLTALGYPFVRIFDGGLEEWLASGFPLEGDHEPPVDPVLDGTFLVDTKESLIRWTGRNLFNHHSGTLRLAGGGIVLNQGRFVSATFGIDMGGIACEDIADTTLNRLLVEHLRSDDFFDVSNHPLASFEATSAVGISGCTDGTPNHLLYGRFTLRGITQDLAFPIQVAISGGGRLTAQAVLDLDRTRFGIIYGSGRFFRFLGEHIVNDHVHLHLKIHADLRS